ncbi:hypothetical protein GCM10023313_07200 [Mucilaginibacter defluvii]|uniref:Uncharacterized protein n=1 Tax=Mucilaginibacter defluvii TaxID=1196019 RepID=A0ABP9FSQ5_9SPHI
MEAVKIIKFYGCYFIADLPADYYLMIDTQNDKVRLIDSDCYGIIEILDELKYDIKKI